MAGYKTNIQSRRKKPALLPAVALLTPSPIILPYPPEDMVVAAGIDDVACEVLCDWMEEHGYPADEIAHLRRGWRRDDLYATIELIRRQVANQPPPLLPYEALESIWQAPGLTAQQRLEAFVRVDTSAARPGIRCIRERQKQARLRLERLEYGDCEIAIHNPCHARGGDRQQTRENYKRRKRTLLAPMEQWNRRAWCSGDDKLAFTIAEKYHKTYPLYQSQRACIAWGYGGQLEEDRDAYSKSYARQYGGARWRNAGVWIDYTDSRNPMVVIENFRGTEVARLHLRGDK